MPNEQPRPRAFAVWFKELARWDPSSFHGVHWHWPNDVMQPLGSVLKLRKERVNRATSAFTDLQPITIHFDGSLDKRKVDPSRAYTMDLYFARPGDIVVAKIDLKNGAVGIVPPDWENVVVTNHFAIYEPDLTQVVPEYLLLIIQTRFFKAHLNRNKVGAEGRKEVKLSFFEAEPIPLPPLHIQQAIVSQWEAAQVKIESAKRKSQTTESSIEEFAVTQAGIYLHELRQRPKAFALQWQGVERWGVGFNRWDWKLSELLSSNLFPMRCLKEIAEVNPSEIVKLNDTNQLVSFVPMEAVSDKEGVLISPQVKKFSEVNKGYTRFMEEDVIWAKITPCMQNGKCAVAKHLENGLGFGSTEFHVIRSKNKNVVLPEYLWVLLRMKHLRQAAQRYFIGSAGQQRVPADFLENLYVPLPPLTAQHEIVAQVQAQRAEIVHLRAEAERLARESKAAVEAQILGTKKIEAN